MESQNLKLALKFNIAITQCNPAKVNEIKEAVAISFGIKSSTLQLHSIQEGSIVVTFIIPAAEAKIILSTDWKSILENSEALRALNLMAVAHNDSPPHNIDTGKKSAGDEKKELTSISSKS